MPHEQEAAAFVKEGGRCVEDPEDFVEAFDHGSLVGVDVSCVLL